MIGDKIEEFLFGELPRKMQEMEAVVKVAIMTTIWSIWLRRNDSIFEDKEERIEVFWNAIDVRIALWLHTRVKEFQMYFL